MEKIRKIRRHWKLDDEEVLLLSKWGFNDPEMLPKPRYKFPPIIFLILDDLIGNNECFIVQCWIVLYQILQ